MYIIYKKNNYIYFRYSTWMDIGHMMNQINETSRYNSWYTSIVLVYDRN